MRILNRNTIFQNYFPKAIRVALGISLLSIWGACQPEIAREEGHYTTDDTKVETGRGVEILYSDSAVVRVRVTAPLLRNYSGPEEPRQEFPEGLKVEFLNAAQKVQNTLTARYGVRRQDKGMVVVRDSVVMVSAKNEKIETEELIWEELTAKIRTDKFVKVSKPDEVIYGFGLEANQDFTYWKILVPKGRIKAEQINQAVQ